MPPQAYAFVTLLTSDSYLPGALVLAGSLRDVHPNPPAAPEVPFQTVCLVTPETVDIKTVKALRRAFDVVVGVEVIEENQDEGLALLGRPDLRLVLTKLHVFRLTNYEKIIFLDADVLPLRPMSHLFSIPHPFSAAPDVGWPDIFNSGVMVLSPGEEKFNELRELVKTRGSWDGGDQGLLNEWRGGDWNRISFTYNTTPTATYTYAPAYERFGSQISAVHFIGQNKPWKGLPWRASGSQSSSSPPSSSPAPPANQASYKYADLVDRWYSVYDRHYRPATLVESELTPTQGIHPKYVAVWDSHDPRDHPGPGLGLEELKRIAIEGVGAGGASFSATSSEGEYRSLPLDGRVDLMRPRPPVIPGEVHISNDQPSTPFYTPLSLTPEPTFKSQHPHHYPSYLQDHSGPGPTYHPPQASHTHWQQPHTLVNSHSQQLGSQHPTSSLHSQQHSHVHSTSPQTSSGPHSTVLQHVSFAPQTTALFASQPTAPFAFPPPKSNDMPHHPSISSLASSFVSTDSSTSSPYTPLVAPRPLRPASPPLMNWNPAVEPPPNVMPISVFAQPSMTAHYSNVWDMSPAPYHLNTGFDAGFAPQLAYMTPKRPGAFFEPPQPTAIPERLIQEGVYQSVISTGPDHSQDASLFPWEKKSRPRATRSFPRGETPPPLPPRPIESETAPPLLYSPLDSSTPTLRTFGRPTSRHWPDLASDPSPTGGPYSNAWDSIPSIQNYVSRLAWPGPFNRPAREIPSTDAYDAPPPPAEEDDSSHDGDDEDDEADYDSGDVDHIRKRSHDDGSGRDRGGRDGGGGGGGNSGNGGNGGWSNSRSGKGASGNRSPTNTRDRRGSRSGSVSGGKRKEYRSIGVQTEEKQTASVTTQTEVSTAPPRTAPHLRMSGVESLLPSNFGARRSPATSRRASSATLPGDTRRPLSPDTYRSGLASPRFQEQSLNHSRQISTSPPMSSPVVTPSATTISNRPTFLHPSPTIDSPTHHMRSISSDTTLTTGSNDSAMTMTLSPVDERPRKMSAGRKWDPARGVDVFKRDSQEVLARFLKIGSWEAAAAGNPNSNPSSPNLGS